MILVGKLKIGEKLFTMNDSEGTVYLAQLGLPDSFYGGVVKEFRKTKYGILMCVDRKGNIINLAYTEERLTDAGRELLFPEPIPEVVITTPEPMPEPMPEESFLAMEDKPIPSVPVKNYVEQKKESVVSVKNSNPKGSGKKRY